MKRMQIFLLLRLKYIVSDAGARVGQGGNVDVRAITN
jgi:hypothetical protein